MPRITDQLADNPFTFTVSKDGRVMIYSGGRLAKTLKGGEATKFLSKAEVAAGRELQLLMAKVTGQFKFGNER